MSRHEDYRNQTFVFININVNLSLSLTGGTYCEDEHINIKERIKEQKFSLVIMVKRAVLLGRVCVCERGSADDSRDGSRHCGGVT